MTPNLTDAGKNLLLRTLAGETITFTKIQLGNGPAQDAKVATELANPLLSVDFSKIEVGEEYVTLTAAFTNSIVTSGFHITEAGFFAKDPDDETKEILYALGNENVSTADYVPDNTNRIFEMEFSALLFVGTVENVAAIINNSLVYASASELTVHIENQENPHSVTKEQVGLGNVPNVSTNNQTPTYRTATTFATLVSGEKMSIAFGKIKLAIEQLILHLANRDNPHKVTAEQTGAAKKAHTHDASDINQGTLPIARGGTGVTSIAALHTLLEQKSMVCGSYVGEGGTSHFVDVGISPSAVIVLCTANPFDQRFSGIATPEFNGVISPDYAADYLSNYDTRYVTVKISPTAKGFIVNDNSAPECAHTDFYGYTYIYFAWE